MPKPPQSFVMQLDLKGAIPDYVIMQLTRMPAFEAATFLRNILSDLAAIVVLREGPDGMANAQQRIKNLADVFVSSGDRHLLALGEAYRAFQEQTAAAALETPSADAIERVAEAEALSKAWLESIAKGSKKGAQP